MLESSFGLLFFLKQPKKKQKTDKYIYCRITVDGTALEFSTKRKCESATWNQSFQRAGGTRDELKSLNEYLDAIKNLVYNKKRELLENCKPITAIALKNAVFGKPEHKYWLIEIYKTYNESARNRIGIDYAKNTVQRFDRVARYVEEYIIDSYGVNDIELKQLDFDFIKDFSNWLKIQKDCGNNTTKKFCSTFKSVILDCVKRKWLAADPFALFSMKYKEVQVYPLTASELHLLETKQLYSTRLTQVKDVFIFCCYTGLAYADAQRLCYDFIQKDMTGDRLIKIPRKKTGTLSVVPVLPQAAAILYKYGMMRKFRKTGQALPVLSNQKMNQYLNEIAEICEFKKRLTFHIARHTFATTVTLGNGVPLETVSKMLGHTSIKQTQHYAVLADMKIKSDMKMLDAKLNLLRKRDYHTQKVGLIDKKPGFRGIIKRLRNILIGRKTGHV